MTDGVSSTRPEAGAGATQRPPAGREKRPRTTYVLYRRYRLMSRLAAAIGAAAGLALVAYSLVPTILAGERVPPTSFAVAGVMIATMTLVPYALVRWRWRKLRATLEED